MPDGAPLTLMPPRLDTRQKIYTFFRHWWGPRFASNMLNNLPLHEHGGRLCMIAYDFPPISMTPRTVSLEGREGDTFRLHATLYGGLPEEHINYLVVKNQLNHRMMIVRRSCAESDFRYQGYPRPEE